MPASLLKSLAKKSGKAIKDVERLWKKAKELTVKAGFDVAASNYYPYVVGIMNKMLGLTEQKLVHQINDIFKEGKE